jgi:hypothetical protein
MRSLALLRVFGAYAQGFPALRIGEVARVPMLAREMLSADGMSQLERRSRGDYVPSVDAERGRAERRRNIMDAVEKRLDGLQSAALLLKPGASSEPASKRTTRKRPHRVQGFFRL